VRKQKIVCVAGTRPEAIKMAPVIEAFKRMSGVELKFVWSGQHYDYNMSRIFFEELQLPEPDANLDVRSGSHTEQTSKVMLGLDKVFREDRPDAVLAEGDTNTVLATGLTAIKEHIIFGHVEAGLRSYDRMMPEEINRTLAADCAELNFAPTPNAAINLLYEGVPPSRIFITGNTIVDMVKKVITDKVRARVATKFRLDTRLVNILLTVHRAENTDSRERLTEIVGALRLLSPNWRIVFPIHPRTTKRLVEFGLLNRLKSFKNVLLTKPLGYIEFLNLLSMMNLVLTDSGGVQEEAMAVNVPTVTLRCNTERPETVWHGWNVLVGVDRNEIVSVSKQVLNDIRFSGRVHCALRPALSRSTRMVNNDGYQTSWTNPIGDGHAGTRIAELTIERLRNGEGICSPKFLETGSAVHSTIRLRRTVTVSEINASGVIVTLVYDSSGIPSIPYPELEVNEGSMVRVFGPADSIDRVAATTKSAVTV